MATNYIQPGNVIDITAGATLTSGTPVLVGVLLCIPLTDIANAAVGSAQIEGVWNLPVATATVVAAGDVLTWDISAGEFIKGAGATGDCVGCAVAITAAASGVTQLAAKLCPGLGAIT